MEYLVLVFLGHCGSLWIVVRSLWGRCGSLWIVVGRCGSLWIVVGRCGSFRVLVTTGHVRMCLTTITRAGVREQLFRWAGKKRELIKDNEIE